MWLKIFVDAPMQCISEIICRLYIFLQTLATCAHMHSVALIISQTIFCGISSTANITKILCPEKFSHSYSKLIPLYSNSIHPPLMTQCLPVCGCAVWGNDFTNILSFIIIVFSGVCVLRVIVPISFLSREN